MPKFYVSRMERVQVYATVEADDKESAIQKFDEHYPGLTGFVGNGGSNKLVGISPGDELDYGVENVEDYADSQAEPA